MNRCCLLIVSVTVVGVSLAAANPPAPDPVAIEEWIDQLTATDSEALVLGRLERMIKADENGLPDFVHAITWCDAPAIRVAIRSGVLQTDNPYFVYAGMPAFADPGDPQRLSELEQLLGRWEDRGDLPREREFDEWRATYLAMDVLLETATAGAVDLFASWCERATPEALGHDFCLREFMRVLSRHHQAPPIAAAAERMFATQGSPWNPAVIDYLRALGFGDGRLLSVRGGEALLGRPEFVGIGLRGQRGIGRWVPAHSGRSAKRSAPRVS